MQKKQTNKDAEAMMCSGNCDWLDMARGEAKDREAGRWGWHSQLGELTRSFPCEVELLDLIL